MKLKHKLSMCMVSGALVFGIGFSSASAQTVSSDSVYAVPVAASISPVNQTKIGSSGTFVKKLSWAGGTTNKYAISYYDGRTVILDEPSGNYYSTTVSSTYNKGALSTKKWSTNLNVSNGTSDTVYGSVTLRDK